MFDTLVIPYSCNFIFMHIPPYFLSMHIPPYFLCGSNILLKACGYLLIKYQFKMLGYLCLRSSVFYKCKMMDILMLV
jgi:hypothetical protein